MIPILRAPNKSQSHHKVWTTKLKKSLETGEAGLVYRTAHLWDMFLPLTVLLRGTSWALPMARKTDREGTLCPHVLMWNRKAPHVSRISCWIDLNAAHWEHTVLVPNHVFTSLWSSDGFKPLSVDQMTWMSRTLENATSLSLPFKAIALTAVCNGKTCANHKSQRQTNLKKKNILTLKCSKSPPSPGLNRMESYPSPCQWPPW